ncbi:MAG: hypothetical protein KIT87_06025 [Anaerolineae bacterium]|nr:hypothetical protein [Anaerolineae bacterium]
MDASGRQRWLAVIVLVAIVYFGVGILFAALANSAAANMVRTWRLAAWFISALAFAAHVGYERFRFRTPPLTTALHTAGAVALGAFGLAVAAILWGQSGATDFQLTRTLAFLVWPVLAGLPAFVVVLAVSALLIRVRPR